LLLTHTFVFLFLPLSCLCPRRNANYREEGVKTEFVYADGAKDDVQLSGDWNDWKAIQCFHEGGGMWSVVTPVPPGPHEFKFIVDGEWKHSNRHPTIGIDDTSLNNVRYVLPEPELDGTGGLRTPALTMPSGVSNVGADKGGGSTLGGGSSFRSRRDSNATMRSRRDSNASRSRRNSNVSRRRDSNVSTGSARKRLTSMGSMSFFTRKSSVTR